MSHEYRLPEEIFTVELQSNEIMLWSNGIQILNDVNRVSTIGLKDFKPQFSTTYIGYLLNYSGLLNTKHML